MKGVCLEFLRRFFVENQREIFLNELEKGFSKDRLKKDKQSETSLYIREEDQKEVFLGCQHRSSEEIS